MLILPHSTAEVNNFLESFPNVFQPPRKTASLPVAALAAFTKYLHSSLHGYRPHAPDLRCSVPTGMRLFQYGHIRFPPQGTGNAAAHSRPTSPLGRLSFLAQEKPQRHRHPSYLPDAPLFVFPSAFSLLVPSPPESSSLLTPQLLRRLSHLPPVYLPAAPSPSCLLAAVFPVTPGNRTFLSFSLFPASFLLTNPAHGAIIAKRKRGEGAPVRFWVWRSW